MHHLRDRGFVHPVASEITPPTVYSNRRRLMQGLAATAAGLAWPALAQTARPGKLPALAGTRSAVAGALTMDKPTPYADATSYNNFYEFGTDKSDPARRMPAALKPRPWTVAGRRRGQEARHLRPRRAAQARADGRAHLPAALRRRLVDGDPVGGLVAVAELIKRVEPTGNAKYVQFVTLADKAQMPGLRSSVLDWPYVEGLRLDEAMHPLTLLAFGMYGEVLPNQNGAPVRLVVPWKYGFKSGKSIVKIRFVDKQPKTSWETAAAGIRLLFQRQPEGRPPALEPGHRAPHRRGRPVRQEAADADVQRLRTAGGPALRRHGPEEVLLTRRRRLASVNSCCCTRRPSRCCLRWRCCRWPGCCGAPWPTRWAPTRPRR
jgi:sulfoxide reductase catalytic subunit YedY